MACETPDQILVGDFVRVQGDAWDFDWVCDGDCSTLSDPVITVRRGDSMAYELVASSETGETSGVRIDAATFTGGGGHLAWTVMPSHTNVPADVWIEVQLSDDGEPNTEMPATRIRVIPQLGS
jgi:hypothetical protein